MRPYHLYAPRPARLRPWAVAARATQPGLASWWRLLAPTLRWAEAHSRRVAYACLGGASLDEADATQRTFVVPAVMALPHRERLITVTRGPMARKKQSRVQFLVRRQVVSLDTRGLTPPLVLLQAAGLGALTRAQRALVQVWAHPLGAPLTLVGGRAQWPVVATALLA